MNYKGTNIIPGWNTPGWEVTSGTATVSTAGVFLDAGSSVRLTLDSSEAIQESSMAKLFIEFYGDFDDNNVYTPESYVNISVHYTDGTKQDIRVVFDVDLCFGYKLYRDTTELVMDGKTCSKIVIDFVNNSTNDLRLNKIELYKSEDVNTEQIKEAASKDVQLAGLTAYEGDVSSGCIAVWKGDPVPTHIEFLKNTSGGLGGLLVNGKDFIPFERVIGNLPTYKEE